MRGTKLMTVRATLLTLIIFTLATGCGKNLESAVATVGDETITLQDLRDEMVRQFRTEREAARKPLEVREKALESLVERRLKVAGARADGYFDKPEIKEREESLLSEAMINRLFEIEILDKVITESVLKETYDKQGTEVQAAHILLRWTPDSAAVRQRAQEIAQEIKGGLAFDQAAEKYTEEPNGKERKGDLGWFSWGRMVTSFQDACWALKEGEVSAPVETNFGVHLIHLTGRRQVENRPPFEEQKETLKEMCRNAMGEQVMASGNAYLDALKADLKYTRDEAKAQRLLTDIQANMQPERKLQEILTSLADGAWKGQELATWKGGALDLPALAKGLERNFRPASSLTTAKDVLDMIDNAAIVPMLTLRAKDKNLDADKDVKKNVKQQIENMVVMTYEREKIKGTINITEEQIAAWFTGHPEDYMHPQKVVVQEILVADKQLADDLAARAKKGENFGKLAKQYTERPDRKGTDGTLEPFQAGRYGKMGEAAFSMKPGDISDPLPIGRNWSVIKIVEIQAPTAKTLDEARTSIRMKLEREERTTRHDQWRAEIEKKVKVVLYKEKLTQLFADIETEGDQQADGGVPAGKKSKNGRPKLPDDY
ncbi:MAG: peptidylprolyl isomerase [Candidatus Delongbacteria bacterium]